ncbi:DUF6928 family protein [Streptomyces sp. NPDC021080]|uniref:DUF6928 family protein n=1 Tax=Streptomyces sp. NPDC021080 TaxID=3365110 RepID=UPI0037AD8F2A
MHADGDVPGLPYAESTADLEHTADMTRRLYPGEIKGSNLWSGVYHPEGKTYAASRPDVEDIGDQRVTVDAPSELPECLVKASAGRRIELHARPMHSVVD